MELGSILLFTAIWWTNLDASHCNLVKELLPCNFYAEAKQEQYLHDVPQNKTFSHQLFILPLAVSYNIV